MTDTARLRELAGKASGSAWEARWVPDMPASSLDFGVISHETGKEVCRVWIRNDVEYLEAVNPTAILSLLDELDASKAALSAAKGVGVKALEWKVSSNGELHWAKHTFGAYHIEEVGRRTPQGVRFYLTPVAQTYRALDEAKAAAQADYTARILSALAAPPSFPSERDAATHRHKKRGSEYVLIGFGKMQSEHWLRPHPGGVLNHRADMAEVAIYRSVDDGSLWVRPKEEFEDGRFEALKASRSDTVGPEAEK